MKFELTRSDVLHDDPHAAPRRPVHLLALLAVVVPENVEQNEIVFFNGHLLKFE